MLPPLFDPAEFPDYALLDSGGGEKLERFGPLVLRRPDPQALWRPRAPRERAEVRAAVRPEEVDLRQVADPERDVALLTRCCDEPCVNDSGTTVPWVWRWMLSSPILVAASIASSRSPRSSQPSLET